MIASLGMRGRPTRTSWVGRLQRLDTTQHTSGQKVVFCKESRSEQREHSKIGGPSLAPGFSLLVSLVRAHPTQRSAPGGCVVHVQLKILAGKARKHQKKQLLTKTMNQKQSIWSKTYKNWLIEDEKKLYFQMRLIPLCKDGTANT